MPASNETDCRQKAVLSVSEHIEQIGLSRAQFYSLVSEGFFLPPVFSLRNRRPMYTADMAQQNMIARMTGEGIDGTPRVFYRRRKDLQSAEASPELMTRRQSSRQHAELASNLRSLGIETTPTKVASAVTECFPRGTDGVDETDILRAVFRHLRSSMSA